MNKHSRPPQKTNYIDYQNNPIPDHDGTMIEIDDVGYQFFDINGRGFIHDGSCVELQDGRKQFFMWDGKALIHDGSPIELSNGQMQYFDQDGVAMWPIDEKKLAPLITKQREVFFDERIAHITKQTPLSKRELEDLRLALLAAEHPDYISRPQGFERSPEMDYLTMEPIDPEVSGYLYLLKSLWCSVWREYQLRHKETLAARYILEYHKKNCSFASNSLAESVLSLELETEFKRAEKSISTPSRLHEIEELGTTKSGLFLLDEKLLNYLKNFREHEKIKKLQAELLSFDGRDQNILKSRIRLWQHPLFMYRCIAEAVWQDRIRQRIETLQKKPPALTYIINEQVHRPMRHGTKFNAEAGKIIDQRGQELAVIDMNETGKTLPSMNIDIIQRILRPENIKILSTVNAHRLLRWEIQTVTRQFVEGMVDARALKVYGGYRELANRLGIGNSKKAAEQLRDIIVWQAAPRFYQPNGRYGNMLSFDYTPSGKGRPAVLQLILGNMMLPHYVYELLNMTETCVSDRRLIPIVDMPPLIGRSNEQGAQPSFQIEILVEMRKGAKEFATNGCVQIPRNKLEELAEKAGLNRRLYLKVLDRWLHDGEDAPAFLNMIEDNRYALGSHYKQAQDFIIQAGKKELAMSKAGKRSVSKRNLGILKDS
jgi:hypothetical protein